jgi:WD40 repeat protein
MENAPNDCLIQIFSYLVDCRDIKTLCLTCNRWNSLHTMNDSSQRLFQNYYHNRWLSSPSHHKSYRTKYIDKHLLEEHWKQGLISKETSFEGHVASIYRSELVLLDDEEEKYGLFSYGFDAMFEWNIQSGRWIKMFKCDAGSDEAVYSDSQIMINGNVYVNKLFNSELHTFTCMCTVLGVTENDVFNYTYEELDYSQESNEKSSIVEIYLRSQDGLQVTYSNAARFKLVFNYKNQTAHVVARHCLFVDIQSDFPYILVIDAAQSLIAYKLGKSSDDSPSNTVILHPCSNVITTSSNYSAEVIASDSNSCIVACATLNGTVEIYRVAKQLDDTILITLMTQIDTLSEYEKFNLDFGRKILLVMGFPPGLRRMTTYLFSIVLTDSLDTCLHVHHISFMDDGVASTYIDRSNCRIASGYNNGDIRVWKLQENGEWNEEHLLLGHEGIVSVVKIMDSGRLVSASTDRSVRVWSLLDGSCIVVRQDIHMNRITDVTFNESLLISASKDTTLQLADFSIPDI